MVWVLGMCPVETLDIREQSSAREPRLPRVTYATVLGVAFSCFPQTYSQTNCLKEEVVPE